MTSYSTPTPIVLSLPYRSTALLVTSLTSFPFSCAFPPAVFIPYYPSYTPRRLESILNRYNSSSHTGIDFTRQGFVSKRSLWRVSTLGVCHGHSSSCSPRTMCHSHCWPARHRRWVYCQQLVAETYVSLVSSDYTTENGMNRSISTSANINALYFHHRSP